jgi:hypothetical protein
MAHPENEHLTEMVAWFRDTYPEIAPLMVYAPRANTKTLEKKGANYGGAELILLHPTGGYSCLCVQVLNATERNSDCHKRWRVLVENEGCKCVTVRTFLAFTQAVEDYLTDSPYA